MRRCLTRLASKPATAGAAAAPPATAAAKKAAFREMLRGELEASNKKSGLNPLIDIKNYRQTAADETESAKQLTSSPPQLFTPKTRAAQHRDLYKIRGAMARRYSDQERIRLTMEVKKIVKRLRSVTMEVKKLKRDAAQRFDTERRTLALQGEFRRLAVLLTPKHFAVATTDQLVTLLMVTRTVQQHAAHIAVCASQILSSRVDSLSPKQLVGVIMAIAEVKDGGITADQRVQMVAHFFAPILRKPHEYLNAMQPREAMQLLHLTLKGGTLPLGASREYLQQLLIAYGEGIASPEGDKKQSASSGEQAKKEEKGGEEAEEEEDTRPPLEVKHVAYICRAVVEHQMASEEAVGFFVRASSVCIDNVLELSGPQISQILLAYATVGYHDVKLFLTLGQRAGDLGETLSANDVGRVIRAFEMTPIGFDDLRNSLESSMRLRSISRQPLM